MRLFFGARLDPTARELLWEAFGRVLLSTPGALDSVRRIAAANLHVTLQFLGECDDAAAERAVKALSRSGVTNIPWEELTFFTAGWGAFPSWNRPRVIWAGIHDDAARAVLNDAARRLAHALDRMDLRREDRGFRAHITVGYPRRGANLRDLRALGSLTAAGDMAAAPAATPSIPFRLEHPALIESVRGPGGSQYQDYRPPGPDLAV